MGNDDVELIGRNAELAGLADLLEQSAGGKAGIALVAGEPGLGKTRLCTDLAKLAESRGFATAWGRCFDGEGAPAYWPWVQVIRACLSLTGTAIMSSVSPSRESELAHLLPELREYGGHAERPESDGARFRLFEEMARFLSAVSTERPLVVIVDDLHNADSSSLLFFEFLARQGFLGPSRVCLAGTYRDPAAAGRPWFPGFVGRVERQVSLRLALRPLAAGDARDLLRRAAGGPLPPDTEDAVIEECGGNPLLLSECARIIDDGDEDAGEAGGVPSALARGIPEILALRLRRVSPLCQRLLEVAAVAGEEFALSALDALEEPPAVRFEALTEAERARIVESREDGRFAFRHQLIRERLYGQMTATERYVLHQKVGEALERAAGANLELYALEVAQHFSRAAPLGTADKAVAYGRLAGELLFRKLAYSEAASAYELAVRSLGYLPQDPAMEEDLQRAIGQARRYDGQNAAARSAFATAANSARLRLATDTTAAESFARSALGFAASAARVGALDVPQSAARERLASLYTMVFDPDALALVEEALAVLGSRNVALRASLLARLAWLLYYTSEGDRRESLASEAVALARDSGDAQTLAFCLWAHHQVLAGRSAGGDRVLLAREILTLARGAGDRELALQGYQSLVAALLEQGDLREAGVEVAHYARSADDGHFAFHQWHSTLVGAAVAIAAGNLNAADGLVSEAFRLARRAQSPNPTLRFTAQRFVLRREQGRLSELGPLEGELAVAFGRIPAWRWAMPLLLAANGREDEARRWIGEADAAGFEVLRTDALRLTALAFATESSVVLGDREVAERVFEELRSATGEHVVIADGIAVLGPVDYYLGRLAALCGRTSEAVGYFASAERTAEVTGMAPTLARIRFERAKLGDGPPDELASDALRMARAIGLADLVEATEAFLADRARKPDALPAGLTSREAEVLALMANGLTNAQIAEALVLSRHTVVRHLANAYAKIGATNRAEATAFVTRNGLG